MWTSPRTWVVSEIVTAALLNTHVRDNEQFLYDQRRELISEQTGTGASATLSFASIPATFRTLELIWHLRSTVAADVTTATLRFNGDSGTNYFYNVLGDGSGKAFTTSFLLGDAPGSSLSATYGEGQMLIPQYAAAHRHGATWSNGTRRGSAGTSADASFTAGGGMWIGASAALTQIDVIAAAGSWDTATKAQLYGIA